MAPTTIRERRRTLRYRNRQEYINSIFCAALPGLRQQMEVWFHLIRNYG
jgi:hypothetical protein